MFQQGMLQNHMGDGFGRGIQGGVDQMWKVNSANQQASVARGALGGRGGGMPQQAAWQPPQMGTREYWDYQRDYQAQKQKQNEFERTQRQFDRDAEYNNRRQENTDSAYQANNNRAFGFLGSMFGQGSPYGGMGGQNIPQMPTQFNTNYGAYGQYQNPSNGSQWPYPPQMGINY